MEDTERHLNIAKNKLKGGFHGRILASWQGRYSTVYSVRISTRCREHSN